MITMLGIESSCDDTAASVVREIHGGQPLILSNEVIGQNELHQEFWWDCARNCCKGSC